MTTQHDTAPATSTGAYEATAPERLGRRTNASMTWRTWPDWLNVALGAHLALAPIWTAGAPAGWFVTLGILIAGVGLWALGTASDRVPEWVQIVLGAVTFLAPWLGGFAAATGAAWTAWILGILVIAFAAVGMSEHRKRI